MGQTAEEALRQRNELRALQQTTPALMKRLTSTCWKISSCKAAALMGTLTRLYLFAQSEGDGELERWHGEGSTSNGGHLGWKPGERAGLNGRECSPRWWWTIIVPGRSTA